MIDDLIIRPLEGEDEYRACVALQEQTWGPGFSERVPAAILKVSQILGGVASGAFEPEGRLVGFVFGMTGLRDGTPVHWSDMLAVHPDRRNAGLGRRLKLHQRDEVMRRGVSRMHWTFDPLRTRNAHLNFVRLGCTAPEYVEQMYGDTDSPLHRGIGTDRFVVHWELDTPLDRPALSRDHAVPPPLALDRARGSDTAPARGPGPGPGPGPGEPRLGLDSAWLEVAVPADIGQLMADDPATAVEWREATRAVFQHYLARGWVVRDFIRDPHHPTYLLERSPL